jgi:hypothetical protein
MNVEELNDKLQEVFRGRLRARQSAFEDRYLIEQHTARGTATTIANLKSHNRVQFKQRHDHIVRARDGYTQVMEVRHGHAFGCVACGARLSTPINETREVRCACGHQNYAAFYVDVNTLITYLRFIDPEQGADLKKRVRENDRKQSFDALHNSRMVHNEGGEAVRDALIESLPTARLSGQTKMWVQE